MLGGHTERSIREGVPRQHLRVISTWIEGGQLGPFTTMRLMTANLVKHETAKVFPNEYAQIEGADALAVKLAELDWADAD